MDDTIASSSALIGDLVSLGDLKVWSVLVTLFGDLAPQKRQNIPGPVLSAITRRIGIRPEALRVALHRLRKDGWIESTKHGRVSHYCLSPFGREETANAHDHVYNTRELPTQQWFVCILNPTDEASEPPDSINIGQNLFLASTSQNQPKDALAAKLLYSRIPLWVAEKVVPPEVSQAYEGLVSVLASNPEGRDEHDPVQRLAERILILHTWRRLVLRHSSLKAAFLGPDWIGNQCRQLVHKRLQFLPKDDLKKIKL